MKGTKPANRSKKRRKKPAPRLVRTPAGAMSKAVQVPAISDVGQIAAPPTQSKLVSNNAGRRSGFPIVGIGASAGGLEALEELFAGIPADSGMAFVVVTHQHPGHTSLLPELLGKTTEMPVLSAADGLKVKPNHVYVDPPGGQLAIFKGVLHRMEIGRRDAPRLPIDYFFRSLAADQKEKAICIILSGTGTDGTLGLKAIKGESGMAMVQQLESAKYTGMPSSAVSTGLADYVLPPAAMPKHLVAYARGPYLATPASTEVTSLAAEPLQKVFVLLRSRTGHDFSAYKATTIRRRIERRMTLHQIKETSQYVRFLEENADEIDVLFKDLLIGVTGFFRDSEAWQSLEREALPALLNSRPDISTMRLWVPGCSTGEEVYSLAILLSECMEDLKKCVDIQIFGTDLDSVAIEAARNGVYPDGIAVDVSPQRLEKYFLRRDGGYRIRKEVREMAIFAVQNVLRDPPFTKLDMISCRNLMIYLNTDLQKRLLPVFHYALKPNGLLMLGTSETVGGFSDLFSPLNKKWKIFRRKDLPFTVHPAVDFLPEPADAGAMEHDVSLFRPIKGNNVAVSVDRLLLGLYAPPCVVINGLGDIFHIHGRTGMFLEPASGHPRLNILDMAREGLRTELASALRQAAAQDKEIIRDNVRVRTNGGTIIATIAVRRLHDPEAVRGLFLVTFHVAPQPPAGAKERKRAHKEPGGRYTQLERELQSMRESLQTTIEELETSNEELKSTNEELQSTNEEMQSTNEELETSKEEMQSLNEELTTVNNELQSKVEELSRSNDDMQNLLNSTEIATVFLGNDLNIKRFTEPAKRLINFIDTDIGRPLSDLVSRLSHDNLVATCREVLRTLVLRQAEVQTRDGHWYLMRIMPYRTAENVIDGLVLTFVDINPIKEAQKSLNRISKVFTEAKEPILILDLTGRILEVNDEAARLYGWLHSELVGQSASMLMDRNRRGDFEECLRACRKNGAVVGFECARVNRLGVESRCLMNFTLLTDEQAVPEAIAVITRQPGQ